jgi:hypothetical protein
MKNPYDINFQSNGEFCKIHIHFYSSDHLSTVVRRSIDKKKQGPYMTILICEFDLQIFFSKFRARVGTKIKIYFLH